MWFAWPVPQPIEAVSSYARRVGDTVRIVLVLPDDLRDQVGDGLGSGRVWLRLVRRNPDDREARRVPVTVDTTGAGPVLVAEVPDDQVPSGLWRLALRVGKGGPLVELEARLLMSRTQPLALLAGPKPTTRMEEPAPR